MGRRASPWPVVLALAVAIAACSGGGTTPRDAAIMSVGGGKTGVSEGDAGAGRGGTLGRDGGALGLGGAPGTGGASSLCAGQDGSCQTQPCCGDLHCCSSATTRTCQPTCGSGAL